METRSHAAMRLAPVGSWCCPGGCSASTGSGDGGRAVHLGLRARIENHVFGGELMCRAAGTVQLRWRRLAS
jgi:hypothetical protein